MDADSGNACPICAHRGPAAELVRYEALRWVKCADCGAGWLTPYRSELERSDDGVQDTYGKYLSERGVFSAVSVEKADWILSEIEPGMTVIEVGPGLGEVARQLRSRAAGQRYMAVEPSPHFAGPLRADGFEVFDGDPVQALGAACSAVAARGSRALVFMDNVLEHVPFPTGAVRQLHSQLNTGSKLLIEVPNESGIDWRYRLQDLLRGSRKPPTFPGHINLFTRRSLARLLREAVGAEPMVRFRAVRSKSDVRYLMQASELPLAVTVALGVLNVLPIDRLLGVPYWLRGSVRLGALTA